MRKKTSAYEKFTEEDWKEFDALYAVLGNAKAAAAELGIDNVRVAQSRAMKLRKDPDFLERCKAARDLYFFETVQGRMQVQRTSLERFESESFEGKVDTRPDYGNLVLKSEHNAHGLVKLIDLMEKTQGTGEEKPTSVVVNVMGPGEKREE